MSHIHAWVSCGWVKSRFKNRMWHIKGLLCVRPGFRGEWEVVLARRGSPARRKERALCTWSGFLCVLQVLLETCLGLAQTLSTWSIKQPDRYASISLSLPYGQGAWNCKTQWWIAYNMMQVMPIINYYLSNVLCGFTLVKWALIKY